MKLLLLFLCAAFVLVAGTATVYTEQMTNHTAPSPGIDGSMIYSIQTQSDSEAAALKAGAASISFGWCAYARNATTINVACSRNGAFEFAKWLTANGYTVSVG